MLDDCEKPTVSLGERTWPLPQASPPTTATHTVPFVGL